MTPTWTKVGLVAVAAWAVACSKSGTTSGPTATIAMTGAGTASKGGGPDQSIPMVPGAPDTSVTTALPPVPRMVNVVANAIGDGVNISFDPIDGARDYRVYTLPADKDVAPSPDGRVSVHNAIYRCGGNRQAPPVPMDGAAQEPGGVVKTLVDGVSVGGFTRTLAGATLGHVYVTPGEGRVPVYALGDPSANGDNSCFFQRWGASRAKKYLTSASDRATALSQRWRDDGVVFYVPALPGSRTRTVFTSAEPNARYYFIDGPESSMRKGKQEAFQVLTAAAPDTQPLMRVYYQNGCGNSHDELVAGRARFDRARQQGDQQPMYDLHWAGITGPTTLVVEALDAVCPWKGMFGPSSRAALNAGGQSYPALMTLDDLRAASATGEVFINGQGAAANHPRPIARTFIQVKPAPPPQFDWFSGFGASDSPGPYKEVACGNPSGCWQQHAFKSAQALVEFQFVDWYAYAPVMGEMWSVYADEAADTPGKFYITPTTKGVMSSDSFLHATMEVDSFTTLRRYPQIVVSDQDAPLQWNMAKGNTLTVITFPDWPNNYLLEVCDHRRWDVNDQCPHYDMYHLAKAEDPSTVTGLGAGPEIGEHVGVDRSTRWDVYFSTRRVYMFFDGLPFGCADLLAKGVPSGPVTLSFGDVLYHSGVDHVFSFHKQYMQVVSSRHYDNVGFKSAVVAPSWDETRFPCVNHFAR